MKPWHLSHMRKVILLNVYAYLSSGARGLNMAYAFMYVPTLCISGKTAQARLGLSFSLCDKYQHLNVAYFWRTRVAYQQLYKQ